ncbi:MAG: N-acetylglucosamine-6-phosphate deacetylase [Planctomycetes bacterium]|nr:N-acetylglucosamine-6-phosphate deacetylase [Planctomycetota bacterium]
MKPILFTNGTILLADRELPLGQVLVVGDRIDQVEARAGAAPADAEVIDLAGGYLSPGFVDVHVHGGAGHDFMDGTEAAFRAVCVAHARHGTTSLLPTTTVARHEQHLAFLEVCRALRDRDTGGARILGAHFYGPYFAREMRGCHPGDPVRAPLEPEYEQYLSFDCITRATVAPELPGAEAFLRACRARGIGGNAGHSHATFEQMEAARTWGVTHVDHLFCAMSDRARLRIEQTYPMRGGVMEATLFFDDLTTEVIADGKHLQRELLLLAYKIKGPDRLALVTDCNRALDMPDGPYVFGPTDGGETILRQDGVGITRDGKSLASGVVGMIECVRTFHRLTGVPLVAVIRMASLTPARIAGAERDLGSIAPGKRADLLVLDRGLNVKQVFVSGTWVP